MNKERYLKALSMRDEEGKKYKEIGEYLGVTASRARDIVIKAHWLAQDGRSIEWCDGLTTRTSNCLRLAEFTDIEHVKEALLNGDLTPGKVPNLGQKSINEISAWLGLDCIDSSPMEKIKMTKQVLAIEELWIDKIENELSNAYGYKLIGYVKSYEQADIITEQAGLEIGDGWPIEKGLQIPRKRAILLKKLM